MDARCQSNGIGILAASSAFLNKGSPSKVVSGTTQKQFTGGTCP